MRLRHAADDQRHRMFDRHARLIRRRAELRGNLCDLRIIQVRHYGINEIAHGLFLELRVDGAVQLQNTTQRMGGRRLARSGSAPYATRPRRTRAPTPQDRTCAHFRPLH